MKTINEMSEQEILNLTDEQLETLVKIRMAEEGIKILTEPEKPNYLPVPEPDITAYEVKGFSYVFANKVAAEMAADSILSFKSDMREEDYLNHYSLKFLTSESRYNEIENVGQIQPKKFYSRKVVLEIESNYDVNERLKNQHTKEHKEYLDNYNAAKGIREEIYTRYSEVVDKHHEMNRMKSKYAEYLTLAENNPEIAMKFLKKAYTIDEETEQFVIA